MASNKTIVTMALVIFIGAVIGAFFLGRATVKVEPTGTTNIERDTVVVRDTITERYPMEVVREVVRTEYKHLTRVERDTITLRDTVLVEIPIEEREYKGLDYRAVVGGYSPYLKSIEVYPTTEYITKTETVTKRKRWGVSIGLQGGYGITPKGWQPYAGLGVSFGYTF